MCTFFVQFVHIFISKCTQKQHHLTDGKITTSGQADRFVLYGSTYSQKNLEMISIRGESFRGEIKGALSAPNSEKIKKLEFDR